MSSRFHSFLVNLGAVGILAGAFYLILFPHFNQNTVATTAATTSETAATGVPFATSSTTFTFSPDTLPHPATTTIVSATTSISSRTHVSQILHASTTVSKKPLTTITPSTNTSSTPQVTRIQNPYPFAQERSDSINTAARGALVNILCMPRGGGSLAPISGSGVIIDSQGIILTNAHVAQYVLLSEDPDINLSCQIRTGSPATARWTAEVLFMPQIWVSTHVSEINTQHPTGTGEHDYALLRITGSIDNTQLPNSFPYVPFDSRDAIGFLGDEVLGASYPAEFLGGLTAENGLYPVSSVSPINQLLTFGTQTVDIIAIGGVIEAQSGSSGGPVLNAWGRLIALIATTSDAPTTGGRDLRAITLSYINRDLVTQTGSDLTEYLLGDLATKQVLFNTTILPTLLKQYVQAITR